MDRYILTAWARKIVIAIFCFAAFFWGIRQLSLTLKIWFPNAQAKQQVIKNADVSVPEAAKTVGEQFLTSYLITGKRESLQEKQDRLVRHSTTHLAQQIMNDPDLSLLEPKIRVDQMYLWNTKWVEAGKKAYLQFQTELEDGRKMLLQLLVVKAGSTWLVDSLPSLLPQPEPQEEMAQASTPTITEAEKRQIEQVVDGFFDSYLKGRLDSNTKPLGKPLTNILEELEGEYQEVTVEITKQNPLQVNATVYITSKGIKLPFQYQLELQKEKGQYVVKKILGG